MIKFDFKQGFCVKIFTKALDKPIYGEVLDYNDLHIKIRTRRSEYMILLADISMLTQTQIPFELEENINDD